jgi:heme/copper-type cytochrome/quinol oxidase subunit 2
MENMEQKSPWPLALKYGLIIAFAQIIINVVFYLIAPDSATKGFSGIGLVQTLIVAIVSIYLLIMAAKLRRDEDMGGYMSYNKSLGFMLVISLPVAVLIGIYTFIFSKYIAPEVFSAVMDKQVEEMYNKGMSEEQVEQSMKYVKMFMSPVVMLIIGTIATYFWMFLYSLIASIFAKKTAPVEDIQ